MAAGAWLLALSVGPDAVVDSDSLATVGISVGLAVGAVLLLPIKRLWVRIVLNPLILAVPILAALGLFLD